MAVKISVLAFTVVTPYGLGRGHFNPEDVYNMFLRNVGSLPTYRYPKANKSVFI
jgi:hypothetical protein